MKQFIYKKLFLESEAEDKDEIVVPLIYNDGDEIAISMPYSKEAKSITDAPIILDEDGNLHINKVKLLNFLNLLKYQLHKAADTLL